MKASVSPKATTGSKEAAKKEVKPKPKK